MDPSGHEIKGSEIEDLRRLVAELTARVFRLERALNLQPEVAAEPRASTSSLPPVVETKPASAPLGGAGPAIETVPVASKKPQCPDLESRIGSHWLNRIGITAVLIGVSYFLKFAFDNEWIGPSGRVAIGMIAGIAVVIWSEKFRSRGYRAFSYSLKAVGIGVLYLSIYAAFQVYSLVPGGIAFIFMFAVTAATAAMAWSQDAEILAAFALIGGFSTPMLLSTGQNREVALFSYVAILDLAALALVILKPWRHLLTLSYAGTLALYIGWYVSFYDLTQLRMTLGFATLFFAIFALGPMLTRPSRRGRLSDSVPPLVAVANAAVYFLQIYVMFKEIGTRDTAWFALALAALYIFLSRQTRGRNDDPAAVRTINLLHLALAIGFITIAIPIRLDAHWITIGWFVESAALLWVADRIHSELMNAFVIGALALGVARLLLIDNFYETAPIWNTRMATYAVAVLVLGALAWQASRRKNETGRIATAVSVVALNLLALRGLSLEVSSYYAHEMTSPIRNLQWDIPQYSQHARIARDFTYSALWMAYGAMLMVVGFWRRSAMVRWQALALIAFTIGKVFIYDVSELDRGYRILSFIVLGALLLAISFMYQRDWLRLSGKNPSENSPAGT